MVQSLLNTQNLSKNYGELTALDKVSLNLNAGDIYGLVGRNGAGKTTLFKCIMGLAKPTSGEIRIEGEVAGQNIARRHIGFMISPSFFSYLNPRQNLEYYRRIKGVRKANEVERLLKLVGLFDVKRPYKTFSLGMKQRLGLAGAMLGEPSIIVLDEPVNGLDPQGILDIRNIIKRENTERGTTFIVSSHILSELDLVATRFGFIEQGKLLQEISHENLHEHTKKSLIIDVDDAQKASQVLSSKLGILDIKTDGNRMILESYIERPNMIAQTLVKNNVELYRLTSQETTLEEYFMRLIGGSIDA